MTRAKMAAYHRANALADCLRYLSRRSARLLARALDASAHAARLQAVWS